MVQGGQCIAPGTTLLVPVVMVVRKEWREGWYQGRQVHVHSLHHCKAVLNFCRHRKALLCGMIAWMREDLRCIPPLGIATYRGGGAGPLTCPVPPSA